jgi:hypothetical protein
MTTKLVTKIHEDLMRMEDKEIKFWDKVDMVPNNMDDDEWIAFRDDYKKHQSRRYRKRKRL